MATKTKELTYFDVINTTLRRHVRENNLKHVSELDIRSILTNILPTCCISSEILPTFHALSSISGHLFKDYFLSFLNEKNIKDDFELCWNNENQFTWRVGVWEKLSFTPPTNLDDFLEQVNPIYYVVRGFNWATGRKLTNRDWGNIHEDWVDFFHKKLFETFNV